MGARGVLIQLLRPAHRLHVDALVCSSAVWEKQARQFIYFFKLLISTQICMASALKLSKTGLLSLKLSGPLARQRSLTVI